MQERAMKGVEAVRHRPADGRPRLGVWLSLEGLLELPLSPEGQLQLLGGVLEGLGNGDSPDRDACRATVLDALGEAELLQASRSLEAGDWWQGRLHWRAALEHQESLEVLRPAEPGLDWLQEGLIQALARLDQALTHQRWRPPVSPLERARVHGLAAELLLQIRGLDQPLPSWFAVVEEGLLRRGGLALLEQSGAACRREGITLLLRWASLQPSLPAWLSARLEQAVLSLLADLPQSSQPIADLQALLEALTDLPELVDDASRCAVVLEALALAQGCLQLAAAAHQPLEVRESLGLQPMAPVEPDRIRLLVQEWLEDHLASEAPVSLELVWIPGARALPHGHGQLALNLAAAPPDRVDAVIEAFAAPLVQAGAGRRWLQRHSSASLLSSLRQLWAAAGVLSAGECRLLARAQECWQHWGEAGQLAATQLPAAWPPARLEPGCRLLRPSALQLAGLRCWLQQRAQLPEALAEIRRHHHDPMFLQQSAARAAEDCGDALATLCALHLQEGLYAASAAPLTSVQRWAQTSLSVLAQSQLLLDPAPLSGSCWAVLQGLAQAPNGLPELVGWPDDASFYGLLAGQEVVLVSPLAAEVEEQHRSGRAFELFVDLAIAPYGLRTLEPPASLYPARPHQGFEASLAACLDGLEGLARERPFAVCLLAAGIYDLPLAQAVGERYGASCLAIGPAIHARFGIDQACSRHWRPAQRRADRWRRMC